MSVLLTSVYIAPIIVFDTRRCLNKFYSVNELKNETLLKLINNISCQYHFLGVVRSINLLLVQ